MNRRRFLAALGLVPAVALVKPSPDERSVVSETIETRTWIKDGKWVTQDRVVSETIEDYTLGRGRVFVNSGEGFRHVGNSPEFTLSLEDIDRDNLKLFMGGGR
jgi:hypothetical protein